jgi:hypothetical protein
MCVKCALFWGLLIILAVLYVRKHGWPKWLRMS